MSCRLVRARTHRSRDTIQNKPRTKPRLTDEFGVEDDFNIATRRVSCNDGTPKPNWHLHAAFKSRNLRPPASHLVMRKIYNTIAKVRFRLASSSACPRVRKIQRPWAKHERHSPAPSPSAPPIEPTAHSSTAPPAQTHTPTLTLDGTPDWINSSIGSTPVSVLHTGPRSAFFVPNVSAAQQPRTQSAYSILQAAPHHHTHQRAQSQQQSSAEEN